ncbi:MAG: haloacid dehalogenase-like hydrolase [Candidatus Diapherotrites archaeon]|nr:haloacid dehalogenase-like hydrolase [Candidatus Diapherotrites archaeon]
MKLAFTDIDGTLLEGFISVGFVDYLVQKGVVKPEYGEAQDNLMQRFYCGGVEYLPWLAEWCGIWAKALTGLRQDDIISESKAFFELFKQNIFPNSKALVGLLHENGFKAVGISVGALEAQERVAEELGLDQVFATTVGVEGGAYTGSITSDLHSADGKERLIKRLLEENNVGKSVCLGFGDTLHDSQIFLNVGKPMPLNPNPALEELANQNGWTVARDSDVLEKVRPLL